MAFQYDPNLTEMERQQQAQGQQGAPAPGGNQPAAGQPAAQPSRSTGGTQSGQFTNLQQYLGANQNQNFGSKVAGRVQQDVDTANQRQQQAGEEFGRQAQAGTVDYDEQLANEAKTNASNVYGDEAKRQKFTSMRDTTYGGPTELADLGSEYTATQGANQNAQKAAQASASEEGQKALLGQYYGRPTYSRGETNLDQFLVQNDATAKPKFQQTRENAGQLEGNFQNLQAQLAGQGQQAAATTQATRDRVSNEFLGEQGAIQQQRKQYEDRAAAENARIEGLREQVRQGKAPADALRGLTTYGTDLNQFLTAQQADAANMLSQQEAGNYRDLNQLLNQQSGLDLGKAGTYQGGLQLDQAGYDQFKQQQENFYNSLFDKGTYQAGEVDKQGNTLSGGYSSVGDYVTDPRIVEAFTKAGIGGEALPGGKTGVSKYQIRQARARANTTDRDLQGFGSKLNQQQYKDLMAMLESNLGRTTKLV